MATKFYLRDLTAAASPTSGDKSAALPSGTLVANSGAGFEDLSLSLTPGTGSSSKIVTLANQTTAQSAYVARFSSDPVTVTSIAANTWTVALRGDEASTNNNAFFALSMYVWRPSTNAVVGYIYDNIASKGTEVAGTGQVFTVAGSAVNNLQAGDIVVMEVWFQATMSKKGSTTATLFFDGPSDVTAGSATDGSYVSTPQTLIVLSNPVSASATFSSTSSAAAAATASHQPGTFAVSASLSATSSMSASLTVPLPSIASLVDEFDSLIRWDDLGTTAITPPAGSLVLYADSSAGGVQRLRTKQSYDFSTGGRLAFTMGLEFGGSGSEFSIALYGTDGFMIFAEARFSPTSVKVTNDAVIAIGTSWDTTKKWWSLRYRPEASEIALEYTDHHVGEGTVWTRLTGVSLQDMPSLQPLSPEFSVTGGFAGAITATVDHVNSPESPSIATFVEEFTDPALPQWTVIDGAAALDVSTGALRIAQPNSSADLFSQKTFDLTGGDRLVGYAQVTGDGELQFGLSGDNGVIANLYITRSAGSYQWYVVNDATDASPTVAYDPSLHGWVSLRYDATDDTMVLETAPTNDGISPTTWTEQTRIPLDYLVPDINRAQVRVALGVLADPNVMSLDHINSPALISASVGSTVVGAANLSALSSVTAQGTVVTVPPTSVMANATVTALSSVTVAGRATRLVSGGTTASSVVSAVPTRQRTTSAALVASTQLASTGRVSRGVSANVLATSALTMAGEPITSLLLTSIDSSTFAPTSSVEAQGLAVRLTGATISASSSLAGVDRVTRGVAASLSSSSAVTASGNVGSLGVGSSVLSASSSVLAQAAVVRGASSAVAVSSSVSSAGSRARAIAAQSPAVSSMVAAVLRTSLVASTVAASSIASASAQRTREGAATTSVVSTSTVSAGVQRTASAASSAASLLALGSVGAPTNGYGYVRKITVDYTKVAGDLVNFPVLVTVSHPTLADVAHGGRVTSAFGHDIILTSDVAGNTRLDHEIESYDPTTGALTLWVRVPSLSASFSVPFYLFYGNASITTSQQNAPGVWGNNYAAVYHFSEDPNGGAPQIKDATGKGRDLIVAPSPFGATISTVVREPGKVGTALGFHSANQYNGYMASTAGASGVGTGGTSIGGWIYFRSFLPWDDSHEGVFGNHGSSYPGMSNIVAIDSTTHQLFPKMGTDGMPSTAKSAPLAVGQWYHVVLVKEGVISRLYVNGVKVVDEAVTGTVDPMPDSPFYLSYVTNRPMDALYDQFALASEARSATWVATEYTNQNDPAAFALVGTEQVQTGSAGSAVLVTRGVGASVGAASILSTGASATRRTGAGISAVATMQANGSNGSISATISTVSQLSASALSRGYRNASVAVETSVAAAVRRGRRTEVSTSSATTATAEAQRTIQGASAVSASASLAAASQVQTTGRSSISSGSNVQSAGQITKHAVSSLSATASMTITAAGEQPVKATLSSTTSMGSTALVQRGVVVTLGTSAAMQAVAVRGVQESAALTVTAGAAASGRVQRGSASVITAGSSMSSGAQRVALVSGATSSTSRTDVKAGRTTTGQANVLVASSINVATDGAKFLNASLSAQSTMSAQGTRVHVGAAELSSSSSEQVQARVTRGAMASASVGATTAGAATVTRFVRIDAASVSAVSADANRTRDVFADVSVVTTTSTSGQRTRHISVQAEAATDLVAASTRTAGVMTVIEVRAKLDGAGRREAFAAMIAGSISTLVCPGLYVPVLSVPHSNRIVLKGLNRGKRVAAAHRLTRVVLPRETHTAEELAPIKIVVIPRR